MKKYIIMLITLFAFASCEEFENSAESSRVTYLASIEMNGESHYDFDCDATGYTDEGAVARLEGEVIPHETSIEGVYFGLNTVSGPDYYEIAYSAANNDDFPVKAARSIFWPECNGDLVTSIAGMYTSSIVRTITEDGSAAGTYTDLGPIFIKDLGNDVYQLSDALGGWYDLGREFGYTGAAPGMTVTANSIATNDFTFGDPVEDRTFGEVVTLKNFTVNAVTKTIKFTADWSAGYTFVVTLTQDE